MKILDEISFLRKGVYYAAYLLKDKDYVKWYISEARRLIKFKDKHKNEDCFIIGTGPSINKMDLNLLNGYNLIGLNKIFLIFKKVKLDLNYLVAVNKYVIEQSKREIEKINCILFLNYIASKAIKKPHIYKIFSGGPYNFSRDMTMPIRTGSTVTYTALQIAYYMGFKRVFLIGIDHNFSQSGTSHVPEVLKGPDINHFDPNYFGGKIWQPADLEQSEISYRIANLVYNRDGREIFDTTVGGKLDIFPKITYSEALNYAKKRRTIR